MDRPNFVSANLLFMNFLMFLKTIKLDFTITRKNFIYLEFLRVLQRFPFSTLVLTENFNCYLFNSSNVDKPAVIILDQLNCLASLADILDFSQLEKNSNW